MAKKKGGRKKAVKASNNAGKRKGTGKGTGKVKADKASAAAVLERFATKSAGTFTVNTYE